VADHAELGVPYCFGNEPFDAPDTWARVKVRSTLRKQGSQGAAPNRRFEQQGYVAVQLFAPVNAGDSALAALCDSVRTVYESLRLTIDLGTYAGSTTDPTTEGRWSMCVVTIPFWFDELR
jgi:hypothetical protein